jgi:hypothetical protein
MLAAAEAAMSPRIPCRLSPEDQAELRRWRPRMIAAFVITVLAMLAAEQAHRYVTLDTQSKVLQAAK